MPSKLQIAAVFTLLAATSHSAASAQSAPVRPPDKVVYISDGQIRLGVDLDLGGAITCFQRIGGRNMVNSHDWGRQIQMSDYSGPVPYEPNGKMPEPSWAGLGWNPIQSGDAFGNRSKVISFTKQGQSLTVKCIPMHWPLNDVPGHCTFTSTITLRANAAIVHCVVALNRQDLTAYPARQQELPAVYTNGPWYRIFTYAGDKPFTHAPLSREPSVFLWRSWLATEHWAALVDTDNRGLGIWEPSAMQFSGGFAGKPGAGGPHDNPTGYLSPNQLEILDHNIVYRYQYTLIAGTTDQIRQYVYSHTRDAERGALPRYTFAHSREHWSYFNATDTGWPIKGELHVLPQTNNPQLIGPLNLWQASDAPVLLLRAAFKGGTGTARIFYRPMSQPGFTAADSLQFAVKSDGKYHTYRISLANAPGYSGAMISMRLDPYENGATGSWIGLREIELMPK